MRYDTLPEYDFKKFPEMDTLTASLEAKCSQLGLVGKFIYNSANFYRLEKVATNYEKAFKRKSMCNIYLEPKEKYRISSTTKPLARFIAELASFQHDLYVIA